jgi:hypothetical protein
MVNDNLPAIGSATLHKIPHGHRAALRRKRRRLAEKWGRVRSQGAVVLSGGAVRLLSRACLVGGLLVLAWAALQLFVTCAIGGGLFWLGMILSSRAGKD